MIVCNDSTKKPNTSVTGELRLPTLSVVIPTRNRANELKELLQTIVNQTYLPIEVVIVDGSLSSTAESIFEFFLEKYALNNCKLKYIKACGSSGLTESRIIGVKASEGEAIFFTDDDTLLNPNVLYSLAAFLNSNPSAFGVQPNIIPSETRFYNSLTERYSNIFHKVLMLDYHKKDTLSVRKSGLGVFPEDLTKAISAQRLSGCCCYRREVFNNFSFDLNLKRWSFMEDLDFSYRLYKKFPKSLWAIPNSKIIHNSSNKARMPAQSKTLMMVVYWFYVFFKDIFECSILNLLAFMWALLGNLAITTSYLTIKRKSGQEWWSLIYLLKAYCLSLKNFQSIFHGKLEFLNNSLQDQICFN
jgi:glucosyl-dolichyl phosphate glucuronosyltransferase